MTNQVNTTGGDPANNTAPATEPSIFGAVEVNQPPIKADPSLPEELTPLVGPDKKYKDVETALKSIPHAQEHIQSLETSLKELRDDLAKRETAEELLRRLEAKAAELPQEVKGVSAQDLEGLVNKVLDSKSEQKKYVDNISMVDTQMKATYGEKATEVLKDKAKELELSIPELQVLAAKSPKAFLAMFSESPKESSQNKSPSLNTDALGAQPSTDKTFAYYQKLRKDNPTMYYSPRVQQEMHQRAKDLGPKFYN